MTAEGRSRHFELSPEFSRTLNFAGLIGMLLVVVSAFVYEFVQQELPCTLCLMQRVAMLGIAFGAAMNLKFGPSPRHYGICAIFAVYGLAVAARQTLLHINPYFDKQTGLPEWSANANPPFGQEVLGLHLYVWGLVIFSVTLLFVGVMLLFGSQFKKLPLHTPRWLLGLVAVGLVALIAVSSAQALTTVAECGLASCPDNGSWDWWLF